MTHTWGWYNASSGNTAASENPGQASGAYIFRPNCTENVKTPCQPFAVAQGKVQLTFTRTAGVQEVHYIFPTPLEASYFKIAISSRSQAHQVFSPWVSNTIRLYQGAASIELDYSVGPVPFEDGLGREVVAVWSTGLCGGVLSGLGWGCISWICDFCCLLTLQISHHKKLALQIPMAVTCKSVFLTFALPGRSTSPTRQ